MKRWIFSLAIIFSASLQESAHQEMIEHEEQEAPGRFMAGEVGYIPPQSVETKALKVKGMQVQGFNGESLQKMEEAFRLLELAVNSEEFKERVINFKNSFGEPQFASNKGLSNQEVYDVFMEGRETLQPDTAGEMNFYLRLYYRPWSRVIGYTTGDTNQININWKFFKGFRPHDVAANLAHEWTHKIGFGHKSAKEHDSVPYAVGYIVGEIAGKYSSENKLH